MDILSHSMTGFAVGTVAASLSGKSFKSCMGIVMVCTLGGALPDIDAISLWGGFDASIGRKLGLIHSGREIYLGKFWYSHHAMTHSLFFGLLMPLLIWGGVFLSNREKQFEKSLKGNKIWMIGFCLATFFYLLEDMPTPFGHWGGVRFLFPSEVYIGGLGKIWWWNNYDTFLIICSTGFLNLCLLIFKNWKPALVSRLCISIFVGGFCLVLYQINTRPYDFQYTTWPIDWNTYESNSKKVQKEILGPNVFDMMERFDNSMKIPF